MRSHESSSSYYQEQFWKPSDEELFCALKEEIKKDKETLKMWLSIMETKMDANMIEDMVISSTNLSK